MHAPCGPARPKTLRRVRLWSAGARTGRLRRLRLLLLAGATAVVAVAAVIALTLVLSR